MKLKFKKETWCYRSENFTIEVVRVITEDRYYKNNWYIYCYIYKNHFLFKTIKDDSIYSCDFPFHGGCSYNKWHYENKKIISKQLGCDYLHSGDDRFYNFKTEEEAKEVFDDAKELFDFLTEKRDN
jgi:hypothetical protein